MQVLHEDITVSKPFIIYTNTLFHETDVFFENLLNENKIPIFKGNNQGYGDLQQTE